MKRNLPPYPTVCVILLACTVLAVAEPEAVTKLDPYVVTGIIPVLKVAEHPMIEPRFGAAVVTKGDYLYIIGGSNRDGTRLDTVERVDLQTGRSTQWTKLKIARRHHRAVVADGKIYVLGGTSGPVDAKNPLSEELSDYAGDDRAIADSLPPNPLAPPENLLKSPGASYFALPYSYEATMEVIDLETSQVALGPEMPFAKALFGCVLVDEQILVIGGQKRKGSDVFCTNTTEVFDFHTRTWSKGINMPTPRRCTAALVDGFVMVLGGYRGSKTLSTVEVLSPREKVWRRLPDLVEPVNPGATVWAGNYLFLFGSQNAPARQLVYDLRSKQLVPYPLVLSNSDFAAAVMHDEKIYVVGGANIRLHDTNQAIQVFAPIAEPVSPVISPPK